MSWIVGQWIGSAKSLHTESLTNPKIADTTPPAPARAAGRISWANEAGVRKEKHGGTISHSTFHTPHYTLHFTLRTLHCTPRSLHFILHTSQFTLQFLHFTLYTLHFKLHTLLFTLYALHSTI